MRVDLLAPILSGVAAVVGALLVAARFRGESTLVDVQTITEINADVRAELERLRADRDECVADRARIAARLADLEEASTDAKKAREQLRACRRRQERLEHRLLDLGQEIPTDEF